jgi:hypothetical protein
MHRTVLALCCGLAGCLTAPRVVTTQGPRPVPRIRLCQHDVPVEETAIRQELLQVAVPGMPLKVARVRLEAQGFRLFSAMPAKYRRSPANLPELISGFDQATERRANSVQFYTNSDEVGAWGQRYFALRILVYFDENMDVTDIEVPPVPSRGQPTRFAWYFARRPDLHEPMGLSVEQARAMMEEAGFRCTPVTTDDHEKSGRPYLYCRAVAETPLGGSIVRVRLFHDDAGTVTDTRVLQDPEFCDEILCMLPDRDDKLAYAVFKTIVFPARLYASLVVGGLEADLAMGRP